MGQGADVPIDGMLLDVSEGVQVETDGTDRVDRNVEHRSERDGINLSDHQIAKRQERKSQPTEKQSLL